MILGVSRLATVRAIVLAKHSPKRNVGADELTLILIPRRSTNSPSS